MTWQKTGYTGPMLMAGDSRHPYIWPSSAG